MDKYVYYCTRCCDFEFDDEDNVSKTCGSCGEQMAPIHSKYYDFRSLDMHEILGKLRVERSLRVDKMVPAKDYAVESHGDVAMDSEVYHGDISFRYSEDASVDEGLSANTEEESEAYVYSYAYGGNEYVDSPDSSSESKSDNISSTTLDNIVDNKADNETDYSSGYSSDYYAVDTVEESEDDTEAGAWAATAAYNRSVAASAETAGSNESESSEGESSSTNLLENIKNDINQAYSPEETSNQMTDSEVMASETTDSAKLSDHSDFMSSLQNATRSIEENKPLEEITFGNDVPDESEDKDIDEVIEEEEKPFEKNGIDYEKYTKNSGVKSVSGRNSNKKVVGTPKTVTLPEEGEMSPASKAMEEIAESAQTSTPIVRAESYRSKSGKMVKAVGASSGGSGYVSNSASKSAVKSVSAKSAGGKSSNIDSSKSSSGGKVSILSIIAFIFSLFAGGGIITLVLSIIDVSKRGDGRKIGLTVAALIINGIWLIIAIGAVVLVSKGMLDIAQYIGFMPFR